MPRLNFFLFTEFPHFLVIGMLGELLFFDFFEGLDLLIGFQELLPLPRHLVSGLVAGMDRLVIALFELRQVHLAARNETDIHAPVLGERFEVALQFLSFVENLPVAVFKFLQFAEGLSQLPEIFFAFS